VLGGIVRAADDNQHLVDQVWRDFVEHAADGVGFIPGGDH
jgi:hypothetical protein